MLVGQTHEEYDFINNRTPVRVVCDADSFPVEYQDLQTGEFRGVIADAIKLIQEETGLNFKFIPLENYKDAWEMLKNGEADMSAGMYLNNAEKEKYGLLSSISYMNSRYTMVLRKGHSVSDSLTIALPENALDIQALLTEKHPDWKIILADGNDECLDMCDADEADGTLIDSIFLQTVYNFNSFHNLQVIPMHTADVPMSCAFAGPNAQLLCDIVNKAIRRIPKSSFTNCITQNSVEITYEPGFFDILQKTLPVLLVILTAFVLFYLLSLRYKEQHFRHLAMTDTVTGLWNDICFRQEVGAALSQPPVEDYQLISMDMEHFRYINSDFGEKAANMILQILAKRIQNILAKKPCTREKWAIFSSYTPRLWPTRSLSSRI